MPNSCIHYESYDYIFKYVTREVVESRYKLLISLYEDFIRKENMTDKVVLNRVILGYAIMDYFSDIARIKQFHGITRVNETKICAYESFWLLRRKPLQVVDAEGNFPFCNEQFIFLRVLQLLSGGDAKIDIFNRQELRPALESLFYFLKFRNCDAQSLEFAFQTFAAGVQFQKLDSPTST